MLNAGFSDYFIPVHLPVAGLLALARLDSVDLALSRVIFSDGQPVGAALIARRG